MQHNAVGLQNVLEVEYVAIIGTRLNASSFLNAEIRSIVFFCPHGWCSRKHFITWGYCWWPWGGTRWSWRCCGWLWPPAPASWPRRSPPDCCRSAPPSSLGSARQKPAAGGSLWKRTNISSSKARVNTTPVGTQTAGTQTTTLSRTPAFRGRKENSYRQFPLNNHRPFRQTDLCVCQEAKTHNSKTTNN